jgi:hypothetical protein
MKEDQAPQMLDAQILKVLMLSTHPHISTRI